MARKKLIPVTIHTPRMQPWRIGISMPFELAIQLGESQNMVVYHGNKLAKLWLVLTNRYTVPRKVLVELWDSVAVEQRKVLTAHACASAESTLVALLADNILDDTSTTQVQNDLTAVLRWLKDANDLDGASLWDELVKRTLKATNPEMDAAYLKMLYSGVKTMDKTLETSYNANDFEKVAYNIKLPDLPDDVQALLLKEL